MFALFAFLRSSHKGQVWVPIVWGKDRASMHEIPYTGQWLGDITFNMLEYPVSIYLTPFSIVVAPNMLDTMFHNLPPQWLDWEGFRLELCKEKGLFP